MCFVCVLQAMEPEHGGPLQDTRRSNYQKQSEKYGFSSLNVSSDEGTQ
jgi:hypothetical protein